MAGVAGLPQTSDFNECDTKQVPQDPVESHASRSDCRTSGPVRSRKKLSDAQRKMLESARDTGNVYAHLSGRSEHGGAVWTIKALRRRGYLNEDCQITDAGLLAISATTALYKRLLSSISIDPESECWNWTGTLKSSGYGTIGVGGRSVVASRASFEEHKGPIPRGMFVLHRCDNPPCINPEHLFLGTPADNVADMIAKGRKAPGRRCPQNGGTDNGRAKITEGDVIAIRAAKGALQRELAKQYGVSRAQISHIRSGKNWNRVGSGVCTHCNRMFENLQHHMRTKHPTITAGSRKEMTQ